MQNCPHCQKSALRQNDVHHLKLLLCTACGTAVVDFSHRHTRTTLPETTIIRR